MRNIKFRGKTGTTEGKKWVYGYLYKIKSFFSEDYQYFIKNEHLQETSVDEDTIGQYTGLKDRNMKEIYEGDIVKFRFKEDREEFPDLIGYIEYQSTFAAFRIMSNQGSFKIDITEIKFIEKIGNIYDNPELLEKGE